MKKKDNTTSVNNDKLYEISLLRPILAIMIVGLHAFCIYNGGWHEPEGFSPNILYAWIGKFCAISTVPAFVFVSGYIYSYQRIRIKREGGAKFIKRKLKRLMLPSIIFSVLYFLFYKECEGLWSFLYSVISGVGHMWYLPMLFWCFLIAWLIEEFFFASKILWPVLFIVSYFSHRFVLPIQLSESLFYFIFFYLGMRTYLYRENLRDNDNFVLVEWLIFAFIAGFIILEVKRPDTSHLVQLLKIIVPGVGVFTAYLLSLFYTRKHDVSDIWINLGEYTMGIYIFQQFILVALYYHTNIPIILGPQLLPWVSFVLTLPLSFSISFFIRKTKVGRQLI